MARKMILDSGHILRNSSTSPEKISANNQEGWLNDS